MEALKRDYQSRCSSLVRLSEQHKQEALKSQALLQRLESQSTSVISQLSHQLVDGTQNIQQTTQRVTALTESLLKTYKVPPELLASSVCRAFLLFKCYSVLFTCFFLLTFHIPFQVPFAEKRMQIELSKVIFVKMFTIT